MQVLKDNSRERIRQAAIQQIMADGYEKASMRNIARDAGMSVGNLYRYYPNKEALFDALMQPVIALFEQQIKNAKMPPPYLDVNFMQENEVLAAMMQYHTTMREEVFLLFLRSKGSKYEHAKKEFIRYVEMSARQLEEAIFGGNEKIIEGDIYFKAVAASFVEGFCIILEEAQDDYCFMKNIVQFTELNIKSVVRTLMSMRDKTVEFRRIDYEEIYRYFSDTCGSERTNHSKSNGQVE